MAKAATGVVIGDCGTELETGRHTYVALQAFKSILGCLSIAYPNLRV